VDDTQRVQIPYSLYHLEDNVFNTFLWQRKFAFGDVVEQILAWQKFEYDEIVFVVLKQINQLDYVLMLTHLENFYFTSLLINLNRFHICFSDHFDCNLVPVTLVSRELNHTKLAFAQVFFDFIKVVHVGKANYMSNCICPFSLESLGREVKNS
jgi:hypothetical protein